MIKSVVFAIVILGFAAISFADVEVFTQTKPLSSVWVAAPNRPHTVVSLYDMTTVNFDTVGDYGFMGQLDNGEAFAGVIHIDKVAPNRCYRVDFNDAELGDMTDPKFCTTGDGHGLKWFSTLLFNKQTTKGAAAAEKMSYVEFQ